MTELIFFALIGLLAWLSDKFGDGTESSSDDPDIIWIRDQSATRNPYTGLYETWDADGKHKFRKTWYGSMYDVDSDSGDEYIGISDDYFI